MTDAEGLIPETSPVAVALMDARVPCDTTDCPRPAAIVELCWDGPGPYWVVIAACWPCHKEQRQKWS